MMKTRRLMISLILVFASMNLFADVLLSPAMGMMKEHPMVPSGREYTDFAKPTPTYTERPADLYDFVAVAICSSPKYNHGAFGSGPYVVEKSISFEVSSFEGMFVSDENPVYKRPFDLYYIERGVRRNESSDSSRTEIRGYGKIEAGEEYIFPELGDWGDRYYRWVWRDIIIQLPLLRFIPMRLNYYTTNLHKFQQFICFFSNDIMLESTIDSLLDMFSL